MTKSAATFVPAALSHKAKGRGRHGRARAANGIMLRGVVLQVYLPLDPALARRRRIDQLASPTVTCDVRVYDPRFDTVLRDVPIMRKSAGLVDSDVWVPREATLDLSQGTLVQDGNGPLITTVIPPSQPENMDGDHVVIAFLNNDLNQPIIIGQLDHARNINNPTILDVTKFKSRSRIRGWSIGMKTDGNIEIDGSQANTGVVLPGVPVQEVPTVPISGNMSIRQAPLTKVSIVDSVLSAPQPPIQGTSFLTDLKDALAEMSVIGVAAGLPTAVIDSMIVKINTSLTTGLPYLASHFETD